MQHYRDVVQDRSGNVIGGAIVTVINHSSGQSAPLYSDANGSIPLTSVITDTNGTFSFYVASGRYDITVSKNGIVLSSVSDVFITVTADYPTAMSQADATAGISTVPQTISAFVLQTQKPTAMDSTTAQTGTSTTPQTVSASVLDGAVEYGAFTPSGTGAVSRTVQSKLRDVVSVMDFMTPAQIADVQARTYALDVTIPCQSALAYVCANGGSLYFPSGIYKITNQLELNGTKGVTLYGDGYSTVIYQTGAYYALKVSTENHCLMDITLSGMVVPINANTIALGGLWINNGHQFKAYNVTIKEFGGRSVNAFGVGTAVLINETYWATLTNFFINQCLNGIKFTGNVTTFAWDNGGIDYTGNYATGAAEGLALDASGNADTNSSELHFNKVYFEAMAGVRNMLFTNNGRAVFTNCGFEIPNTGDYTKNNPKVIEANNPYKLYFKNTSFSGFRTDAFFTGTLSFISGTLLQLDIDGCIFYQNVSLTSGTALILFNIRSNALAFKLTNNVFINTGMVSYIASESALYYVDSTYTPYSFYCKNNKIGNNNPQSNNLYFDTFPKSIVGASAPVITLTGTLTSTVLYTKTVAPNTLGAGNGFKITAWGRRTGTAGSKQILISLSTTGSPGTFPATSAATTAVSWKSEIIIFNREYNALSLNIVSVDGGTTTTDSYTTPRDVNTYGLTININGSLSNVADSITLDGILVDRF